MKRSLILPAVLAAALLLPAAATAASLAPLHAPAAAGAGHTALRAAARGDAPLRYVPLARTLSGTGTISLNVYQYAGAAEVNAEANWWVWESTDWGTGYDTTDASGHVTLSNVPAATSNNGEIAVYLDYPDFGMYDLWNMSWNASGWSGGLQPGLLQLNIARSGDSYWNTWNAATVRLTSLPGAEVHLARTDIARTGDVTTGYARTITTGSETLDTGTVYFWDAEGMELPVAGTAVSSGVLASPALDVNEADAQAIWTNGWGSGKPGTKTKLVLNRYPAGWVNDIGGMADWPATAPVKSFGTKTSSGGTNESRSITIPSGTAPGYAYRIWADHTTGPLSLMTSFQTCTLKASKAAIRRGGAIKLSGVVPVRGNLGNHRGITKRVTIYKTTKSTSSQPTSWTPKRSIWTKVATVRANGLGKFTSCSLRPTRTTRYVVRYPGDSQYWGAFTSLCKVTVH